MAVKDVKRTTVYIRPKIHKALKLKSVETSRSISDLINEALERELLEDFEDLKVFDERKNELGISYEEFLKELKNEGRI